MQVSRSDVDLSNCEAAHNPPITTMLTEKQILNRKNITEDTEPIARIIYEEVFRRDERYCDWESATYKAPEQPEGFAFFLSFAVANEITKLKRK